MLIIFETTSVFAKITEKDIFKLENARYYEKYREIEQDNGIFYYMLFCDEIIIINSESGPNKKIICADALTFFADIETKVHVYISGPEAKVKVDTNNEDSQKLFYQIKGNMRFR